MITGAEAARVLEGNLASLTALARDVDDDQARWKPAADRWSIVEVVCHLADEEREDFGRRLSLTLSDPSREWPSIAPGEWVTERGYNQRHLRDALESFREARQQSVRWLPGVAADQLAQAHHHGDREMTAAELLASWVAHDFLHLRQLAGLRFLLTAQTAAPYSVAYSGRENLE